ncbi:LacI family DNA-binding transcriptional regulator [Algoriphagus sp. AK58]|uniref:LacI family DNA-binding transcriptional regulator n=1 Tax=Algoriphagus sp. AK58 TaxID=1406877 RepID=UPI0016507655|nr:LacI family DNA-binding transcriptional regulator [Algoriphagus sp. AK58]MBC6368194.1 LacI family transcriptional regulator [Algoriphagus sp. AK58]
MAEKRKVTLKDIAKDLNLSPSTVSRALNGYPSLSEDTIQMVKEYAEKHNYVPNTMAVNFRKNRTSILGMIVPQIVHHFFSTTISGAMETAKKHGYSILLAQSYDLLKDEILASQYLLGMGVDGLLISVSNETKEADHLQAFLDEGKPVIQFDKVTDQLPGPKIEVDDFQGAYQAVTHLIRQGYRKIAHLSGRMEVKNAHERFLGYQKALEDHGLEFKESLVKNCFAISEEEGFEFTRDLMNSEEKPDALFCITDLVALGAMNYLKSSGYQIPTQVGLIGFSNWMLSEYTTPSLSSVDQYGYRMGSRAAEWMIELLKNQDMGQNETLEMKTELVVRGSSMRS